MNKDKIKQISVYVLAVVGLVAILFSVFFIWGNNISSPGISFNKALNIQTASDVMMGESAMPIATYDYNSTEATRDNSISNDEQPLGDNNLTDRKITKNGELRLLVSDAEKIAEQINQTTISLGGFIQNQNIREIKDGAKSGVMTVKVPADKFDEAINTFKALGIKVENITINAKDVTDQYIDLAAQLKNLKAEEQRYLDVLNRAYSIEDILKVSQYLSRVRGQIERLEGQLIYLDRQIEMSTITIYLTAEAEIEVLNLRWRPLYEIKKSLQNLLVGLQTYANIVIGFVFFLPVLLIWLLSFVLILWLLIKLIKWLISKNKQKKPNLPQ